MTQPNQQVEVTDDEKYFRKPWMTDDQWRCSLVAARLKCGFHHITNLQRAGKGIAFDELGDWSTFDFDTMTRAVLIAHEECVRISVGTRRMSDDEKAGSPFEGVDLYSAYMEVQIHPRKPLGQGMGQRHPNIADLVYQIDQLTGGGE